MKKPKTLGSIKKQGNFSNKENKLIEKAYLFMEKAFNQKSNFKGIKHSSYVGYLLAKWKQNGNAVSAGLLHDVVEDCGIKLSEIENQFGKKVAFYVDGMSWSKRKINGQLEKDYNGLYKKFLKYVNQDPALVILKASDEMSRPTRKNINEFIESLKEKGLWENFQWMTNGRMRGFWIPFFEEMGLNKVAKKIESNGSFVKKENIEITLYSYISKEDLKIIKTKLRKQKGLEYLRN